MLHIPDQAEERHRQTSSQAEACALSGDHALTICRRLIEEESFARYRDDAQLVPLALE